MSRLCKVRCGGLAFAVLLASGCASLGGNVKGSFACRAPEGSCAPTSAIDAEATRMAGDADLIRQRTGPLPGGSAAADSARRLQIVLAAHRDAQGRDHDARVVHVILPEAPQEGWRAPANRREVLRSLGSALTGPAQPLASDMPFETQAHLPDVLFTPSQQVPALPGATAPETGGSVLPPPQARVPHPENSEGESR